MFQLSTVTFLAITLIYIHGNVALQVTSPAADSVWNLKDGNTITWTTVSTDPSTFNVVLVNNNPSCAPTGMSQVIKENVSTSDGKYQFSGAHEVKECGGYQINFVAVNNNGILAQSAPFKVSSSAQSSQPTVNTTTDGIQLPLNGTTDSTPLGANTTELGGNSANKTQSAANATFNSSQKVTPPANSPNGTAGSSSASAIAWSLPTTLASSLLSVVFSMI